MKDRVKEKIKTATSLKDVEMGLVEALQEARKHSTIIKIGYVSGIITSDGKESIQTNLEKLSRHTESLREKHDFFIFSPTDIFTTDIFTKINGKKLE